MTGHTSRRARLWFGLVALLVLVALGIRVGLSVDGYGDADTTAGRLLNDSSYFTIQSNIVVGLVSGALALRQVEPSWGFRLLQVTSVVAIAFTGVGYYVLLGAESHGGWATAADLLLHAAIPSLAIVGWLLFGPRRPNLGSKVVFVLAFPALWLTWTLARGAVTDAYPYPFVDVVDLGYLVVLTNTLIIGVAMTATALLVVYADRRRDAAG